MIVHRNPEAGHYQTLLAFTEHETVSPLGAPNSALSVGQFLLPPG